MSPRKRGEGQTRFYTTHEVARIFGVSPPTVVNWVKAGRMEAVRTPGGHRRIKGSEIAAFAREHQYPVPDGLMAAEGLRVLVVDDERDFADTVREYVSLRTDANVVVACSGFDAGLALERFRPHVVVLDCQMRDLDAVEALERMCDEGITERTRVIACMDYRDAALERRFDFQQLGGRVYKPVKMDELVALIERVADA